MANHGADRPLPSRDTVSDEVERILGEQRKSCDSLDTRCGLALAFAGALVAVTREDPRLLVVCGRIVAAIAGVISLTAVFPWPEPEPLKPKRLLRHLEADAGVTIGFLLMFKARYYEACHLLLKWKRWGLRLSLALLAISVTLLALGVTLSDAPGGVA